VKRKSSLVLDSFALLLIFLDQPGYERILNMLQDAAAGRLTLYLSSINLGEILYQVERRKGEDSAVTTLAYIDNMPITQLPATRERVIFAARIKARFPVSYADAFAIAAAREFDCPVVTGDPEFRRVEQAGMVKLMWMGA